MIWARMLAYITGTVDQELLLRNEYLAAENRILRAQISGQQSSQHYTVFDTRGRKYDCSIAAQSNALTSFSEGCTDTPKVIP